MTHVNHGLRFPAFFVFAGEALASTSKHKHDELVSSLRNRKGNVGPSAHRLWLASKDFAGRPLVGYYDPSAVVVDGTLNERDCSQVFVVNSAARDRDGDVVLPIGCRTTNYAGNPVWFFEHREHPLPIATARNPLTKQLAVYSSPQDVKVTAWFDQGSEFAMEIFRLVASGFLNAASVGFDPLEMERLYPELSSRKSVSKRATDEVAGKKNKPGWLVRVWDMLENSVTGVGSNPDALATEFGRRRYSGATVKALKSYTAQPKGSLFMERLKWADKAGEFEEGKFGTKAWSDAAREAAARSRQAHAHSGAADKESRATGHRDAIGHSSEAQKMSAHAFTNAAKPTSSHRANQNVLEGHTLAAESHEDAAAMHEKHGHKLAAAAHRTAAASHRSALDAHSALYAESKRASNMAIKSDPPIDPAGGSAADEPQSAGPELQAILVPQGDTYPDQAAAAKWITDSGYKADMASEATTEDGKKVFVFEQRDQGEFDPDSLSVSVLDGEVQAVVGSLVSAGPGSTEQPVEGGEPPAEPPTESAPVAEETPPPETPGETPPPEEKTPVTKELEPGAEGLEDATMKPGAVLAKALADMIKSALPMQERESICKLCDTFLKSLAKLTAKEYPEHDFGLKEHMVAETAGSDGGFVTEKADDDSDEDDEVVTDKSGKRYVVKSRKSFMTKRVRSIVKEATDWMDEHAEEKNLTKAQKAACRYHSRSVKEMEVPEDDPGKSKPVEKAKPATATKTVETPTPASTIDWSKVMGALDSTASNINGRFDKLSRMLPKSRNGQPAHVGQEQT